MTNDQKMWAYCQAAMTQHQKTGWKQPAFVPSRVRLHRQIRGDFMFARIAAGPGDMDSTSNQWGAVSVVGENGETLGLRPAEFEALEWSDNPHFTQEDKL